MMHFPEFMYKMSVEKNKARIFDLNNEKLSSIKEKVCWARPGKKK